jgi:hypothetical protein
VDVAQMWFGTSGASPRNELRFVLWENLELSQGDTWCCLTKSDALQKVWGTTFGFSSISLQDNLGDGLIPT